MVSGSTPLFPRQRPAVREHEILRVSALLAGDNPDEAIDIGRKAVLQWAQNRTTGKLPEEAWKNALSSHHAQQGRPCCACCSNSLRMQAPKANRPIPALGVVFHSYYTVFDLLCTPLHSNQPVDTCDRHQIHPLYRYEDAAPPMH